MNSEVRWRQRFSNYKKAFEQLTKFVEKGDLNEFEKQGIIQCFEYTYELAWNTLKDFLEDQGYSIIGPRAAITKAFEVGLIEDGHLWLKMLTNRNLSSHTYDEELTNEIVGFIYNSAYNLFSEIKNRLDNE